MDVEGWKVGDPYVPSYIVLEQERRVSDDFPSVPYAALAKSFALIEATTKRIEKTSLLTSLMLLVIQRGKAGDTNSLLQTVYLCINRVCHSPLTLRVGFFRLIGPSTALPRLHGY